MAKHPQEQKPSNSNALKELFKTFDFDSKGRAVKPRERGNAFEDLAQIYFSQDKKFENLYFKVTSFEEWAKETGKTTGNDRGIDLVGYLKDGSGYDAIQAKYYRQDYRMGFGEGVSNFLDLSHRLGFKGRRWISTCAFTSNALEAISESTPPVKLTTVSDLEESSVDWSEWISTGKVEQQAPKGLFPYQQEAVDKTVAALKNGTIEAPSKGRLLMACGTGKTFTSLNIAEQLGGKGGTVLFLAPSLHLISQTLTEWTHQTNLKMLSFAVCSDSEIGKRKKEGLGAAESDLEYPATTNAESLVKELEKAQSDPDNKDALTVIFSTYQSSGVIAEAQALGMNPLDIVICDEAHRTSGATGKDEETKSFQLVLDENKIKRARTVFMTATPRVFSTDAMEKAKDIDATLYSMDDESTYGEIIFEISFADAVKLGRLCPYKIVVLGIPESEVAEAVPSVLRDPNNNVNLDIASRIIGSWKALSREDMQGETSIEPMRKAVAFCSTIDPKARENNIASKTIEAAFSNVVEEYVERRAQNHPEAGKGAFCEVKHISGEHNAAEKSAALSWLKEDVDPMGQEGEKREVCRILSNVRCLSEGVDVPALDAVVFLAPRNSEVDVVQSVGRVMRISEGKERGYIIIPVVVPEGKTEAEYFTKTKNNPFRAVWTVLQALRAHDTSLDDELDRINLGCSIDKSRMEVVCVAPLSAPRKKKAANKLNQTLSDDASGTEHQSKKKNLKPQAEIDAENAERYRQDIEQKSFNFDREKLENALYSKIVQKVGNRNPYERWSKDVQRIVERQIKSIERLINGDLHADEAHKQAAEKARVVFANLKKELHASINPNISDTDIIEMLAQHLVTSPVFDALFGTNESLAVNPVSKALDIVVAELHANGLAKEQASLEPLYVSVKAKVTNAPAHVRKALTIQLYNDFFRTAFKRQADKLGLVYTPIPLVDFVIRSVEWVLNEKFKTGMGSEKVSVLDPFTGTGTFISRLIELRKKNEDGSLGEFIIPDEKLSDKYLSAEKGDAVLGKPGLWANEIVLLAYHVASVSISAAYEARTGKRDAFGGLCLADTFNLTENVKGQINTDKLSGYLKNNSDRIIAEESAPIRVIIGNPPYSSGAKQAGGVQNEKYESLDSRIEETYVAKSDVVRASALYDSYIRAYRWASDRIGEQGVVGFITNAGFIESAAGAGIRKSWEEEFSNVWVFHLRGNARTKGEQRRQEGDNVFDQGSRAPIAVVILAKDPAHKGKADIKFCDIGDYLKVKEIFAHADSVELEDAPKTDKFYWINKFGSIAGIPDKAADKGQKQSDDLPCNEDGLFRRWQDIKPDDNGDWLAKGDDSFNKFMVMGDNKDKSAVTIFNLYSLGVATNRDAWVWNFSKPQIEKSLQEQIGTYEAERKRLNVQGLLAKGVREKEFKNSSDYNTHKISWTRAVTSDLMKDKGLSLEDVDVRIGSYRPFTKQSFAYSRRLNEMVYRQPSIYPIDMPDVENLAICATGLSAGSFSCCLTKQVTDLNFLEAGAQCYPLYIYEEQSTDDGLFAGRGSNEKSYKRRDAISDLGLKHFQDAYSDIKISKEDLFYYIYGLLHSEEYRSKYANNLSKELPRIPRVKTSKDFTIFMKAGRALADLHLNYEDQKSLFELDDAKHVSIRKAEDDKATYRVEKMRFGTGKDKSVLNYNNRIQITGIPLEVYDYVINGRSAPDWVVERQQIKTDKRSGITNDPNDWANEQEKDPAYPLKLFLKVCTVSLETMKIVQSLPVLSVLDK